jgi:hypothetical protein
LALKIGSNGLELRKPVLGITGSLFLFLALDRQKVYSPAEAHEHTKHRQCEESSRDDFSLALADQTAEGFLYEIWSLSEAFLTILGLKITA